MRIFHEPKVILLARPILDPYGVGQTLSEYGFPEGAGWVREQGDGDADGLAELMGRQCYGSFGRRQGRVGAVAYHANILASGHGSIMEHACFSFLIARVSRGFTHQIVRHRAGFGFSQESQHFVRYTEDDDDDGAQEAGLILTGVPNALHQLWRENAAHALENYAAAWTEMKASGMKKKEACERARGLLPASLESRIGVTMNARAARHFCELRGTVDNALEIRLVACMVALLMMAEIPAMFQDFEVNQAMDGHPIVKSEHRKV